ncbi:lysozyme inhibitor LprI family protein [Rheinheimera texasensis]|uniref:lysozyme inhibitor LprI family protein n=1 Tax=Rheinheimera texasensis TaxID=306205 RepID=UPI0012FF4D8C|nr:lysozyme inhibitor LprI family protein [Rheinheimera texasensis]
MRNAQRCLLFTASVVLSMVAAVSRATTELCGPGWVEATEATLAVTDGAGHGPDLGSAEWAAALTRRLGGHQQPGTQAWCDWVSQQLQRKNSGPAFDCKQVPANSAEALICQNPRLSQLDQQLAQVFAKASTLAANEHPPQLKAEQRGWLKGRDECWKDAAQIPCMQDAYQRRIAELQARYRLVSMRGPLIYQCGVTPADDLVLSYFATEPATVIAERGDSVSLMFLQRKGGYYIGRNETLWPQQDGVRLQWGYEAPVFSCRPVP